MVYIDLFSVSVLSLCAFVGSAGLPPADIILLSRDRSRLIQAQYMLLKFMSSIVSVPSKIAYLLFAYWLRLNSVDFPPSDVCTKLLGFSQNVEKAFASCKHMQGELFCLPPTTIGRIARSLSVTLSERACLSVVLKSALEFPVLCHCEGSAGVIFDSSLPRYCQTPICREVSMSSNCMLATPLCTLSYGGQVEVHVSFSDPPAVSRRSPVQMDNLRTSLCGSRSSRVKTKWLYPFSLGTVNRLPVFERSRFALQSGFSNRTASHLWLTFSKKVGLTLSASGKERPQTLQRCFEEMRAVLPAAYSNAVHRTLDCCLSSPNLLVPIVGVYALVSPLWAKVYVGAVGFRGPRPAIARYLEHARHAQMWASDRSKSHFVRRRPSLYSAWANVGLENVVQILLCHCSREELADVERYFIRKLSPVLNIASASWNWEVVRLPRHVLGIEGSSDILTVASRILRRNHPRLSSQAWTRLIAAVMEAGDRQLAMQLARLARATCKDLRKLRTTPRITLPCNVPERVRRLLQRAAVNGLLQVPTFQRNANYVVSITCGRVAWRHSPYLIDLLAPVSQPIDKVTHCSCHNLIKPGMNFRGHLLTRNWTTLPPCTTLADSIVSFQSLQVRAIPDFDVIWNYFRIGLEHLFKNIGWDPDQTSHPVQDVLQSCWDILRCWYGRVSSSLHLCKLRSASRKVHQSGLVFVAIDRNPGRVICLCIEAWKELQKAAFLDAPRYRAAGTDRIDLLGDNYVNAVKDSLSSHIKQATGQSVACRKPKGAGPPFANWTIKQKSKTAATPMIIKWRPII